MQIINELETIELIIYQIGQAGGRRWAGGVMQSLSQQIRTARTASRIDSYTA